MKLYGNSASPFARKCQVVAHELDLKLEVIRTLPVQDENFRRVNPLGKIPALVLDDGSVLIDSPVICEYLNHLGGGKFFPGNNIFKNSSGRWKALGLQALGDGLADAAVAFIMLGREAAVPENYRARQMDTITATLDVLERTKFAETPTIGEIAVACAIGYVSFRLPDMDWRASRPKLAAWYDRFCEYPAMKATVPTAP
ncbi:MAG: glutathione S-transferase N-terminal domain-containing protein [Alphaproteobacteria bacterium]|nr:glutathione S-transferase N-terminal domain-containing protein [Alphaproteobacteria bacterium]